LAAPFRKSGLCRIGAPIESRWACREHFSTNDPAHLTLPQAHTLAFSPVAFPQSVPRDQREASQVHLLLSCIPARLRAGARVLCLDEKTNREPTASCALQHSPRTPGLPTHVEQEYQRAGARPLFAAFDTRTGKVTALTARRKRQAAFITLRDPRSIRRLLPG
jgi:hypothetical protein